MLSSMRTSRPILLRRLKVSSGQRAALSLYKKPPFWNEPEVSWTIYLYRFAISITNVYAEAICQILA